MDGLGLRTFREGVLGGRESVKGFRVSATDGKAGRVSWATYAPGDSYLVLTTGLLRRTHRVLPAGSVTSVGDGEVRVELEPGRDCAHAASPACGGPGGGG